VDGNVEGETVRLNVLEFWGMATETLRYVVTEGAWLSDQSPGLIPFSLSHPR
jgi:hypothetical protein